MAIRDGRARLIATWTRRTGPEAANHIWRTIKFGIWGPLLLPVWPVAFVVASVYQLTFLHVLGFVVLGIDVVVLLLAAHHLRAFHRSASAFLGVHVGWNDPPSDEAKFRRWCEAKGIPAR